MSTGWKQTSNPGVAELTIGRLNLKVFNAEPVDHGWCWRIAVDGARKSVLIDGAVGLPTKDAAKDAAITAARVYANSVLQEIAGAAGSERPSRVEPAASNTGKITADNPHREYFPAYQLSYWRGGTACARDEAEFVHLEQHIPNDGTRTVTELWLHHPQNTQLLDKLRAALDVAFAAGQAAKAEELRKALGVPK
ncbi:MAG: hypothetical protein ACOY6K_12510 [Pseudomonadota bacterium]